MTLQFNEHNPRSLAKVITFRVLLTISHVINAWIATGSWADGFKIAALATVINSIIYWLHERAWARGNWSRIISASTYQEKQLRTVGKMVSWRFAITASNFLIPYFISGSFGSAAIFVGLATVVNIIIYWAHDRAWDRITWGKTVTD
jgi:uncharacterized membrane protein